MKQLRKALDEALTGARAAEMRGQYGYAADLFGRAATIARELGQDTREITDRWAACEARRKD